MPDERLGLHGALQALDSALGERFAAAEAENHHDRKRIDAFEREMASLRSRLDQLRDALNTVISALSKPSRFILSIADENGDIVSNPSAPVQIADNDTSKSVILTFTDALNFPTSDPTATVAFASSAPAIATVGAPTVDPVTGDVKGAIAPVGLGAVSFQATVTNSDGSTVNGSPVSAEIIAGPPTGFALSIG
jgi:hypothetical protein